jgi:hypothetical protein
LSRAQAQGVLSREARRLVLQSAAAVYYKDRTWERILAAAVQNGMAAEDAASLKGWLKTNSFDLKRRDAGSLIRLVQEREDSFDEPLQVSYEFEDTTFWRDLVDRHEPEAEEDLRTAV